ncbi:MAG: NAD(P)H-hydrate dehydratase [Dehalococcoidia bacterium]
MEPDLFAVTSAEMRAAEAWTETHGTSTAVLMDRAGRAVADAVAELLAERPGPVLVIAGPGNNGGDGLIAAARLADDGYEVTVVHLLRRAEPDAPLEAARASRVRLTAWSDPEGPAVLRKAATRAAVVVDALLGTGVSRPFEGAVAEVARMIADRSPRAQLVAVDLPSGVNADNGAADPLALRADVTIAFAAPKLGCFLPPASRLTGALRVADIGIPPRAFGGVMRETLSPALAASLVPVRPPDGHKGTFGKVLAVAGSERYVGAPLLLISAVLRSGAGLVVLATGRSTYERLASRVLEGTYLPLPEEGGGLGPAAVEAILGACEAEGVDALAIGPGLGRSPVTDRAVAALLRRLTLPSVIDADALNALAEQSDWAAILPDHSVLTPHPGEAARLLRSSVREVEDDRLGALRALTGKRAVVVLKGAHTLIGAADGRIRIQPVANPALGSGGSGDVLTGVIAGLLAQGLEPFDAASLGVALHARAGERWSAENGDGGLVASDLLAEIPRARATLRVEGGLLPTSDVP